MWHELTRSTAACLDGPGWMDASLDPFFAAETWSPPGFKHLHRPFYQADSLQLGIPRTWLVRLVVNGCDDMGRSWKAWQSRVLVVSCKENGCIKGGCENPF